MFEIISLIVNIIVWIGIVLGSFLMGMLAYEDKKHFFLGVLAFGFTGGILITVKALVVKFYTWLF